MDKITTLAKEMNVTENDLIGFLSAIKLWMNKGYTMEDAIAKNMQQMTRLVNNSYKLAHNENMKEIAISAFYN